MKIYHNPRCSKSRATLSLIKEKGINPEVIEYLKDVPTADELKTLLMKLNLKATDILRKGENIFKEQFRDKNFTEEEWIQIMIENPKLIERPIVVEKNRAIIGRPPDRVLSLL